MTWLSRISSLFGSSRSTVNIAHPRDPVLTAMFAPPIDAGVDVNPASAMSVTAVYACVAFIAETLAMLPLHVYRRKPDGGREKATDHWLYPLLHDAPMEGLSAFEFREMLVTDCCFHGDGFARIRHNGAGRVVEIEPLPAGLVFPEVDPKRRVRFRVFQADGASRVLFGDEVFRLPFKRRDLVHSMSPIDVHRETIGTALATRRYMARTFKNSAQPKGALKFPTSLSPEAVDAAREAWRRKHEGPENAGRLAILHGGMEWQQIGMTNADAQYVELLGLSVADIARIFRVPPHKIGDLSRSTNNNIEHQGIEVVSDLISSWASRIEQRLAVTFLSAAERQEYEIEHDLNQLLRGDSTARANYFSKSIQTGVMTPNEARAASGLNPYEGGNEFWMQGAMVPVSKYDAHLSASRPQQTTPSTSDPDGGNPDES